MTTTITFEVAAFADAVKKASLVAPSRGDAFDKAHGIILDILPNSSIQCVIRTTNLAVFSAEGVTALSASGLNVRWRLASGVLSSVMAAMPSSHGKTVTFKQEGDKVSISSGRTKAQMNLLDPSSYPAWPQFDSGDMESVPGLGGKIAMVEWAISANDSPPFNGIHLDGENIIATDHYKMARVRCKVALDHPVTIPPSILASILRPLTDVQIAAREATLEILVSDLHQVTTVIFGVPYPSAQIIKVMERQFPQSIEVGKQDVLNLINLACSFTANERAPIVELIIGKGELAAHMVNAEIGFLGDVIEIPGQAGHKRVKIYFSPKYLTDAIGKSPGSRVRLYYDPEQPRRPIKISDLSNEYEAWIQPRKSLEDQEDQ